MCNDDLSQRRTASVLASCTLQSAIFFTNGAIDLTDNIYMDSLSATDVIQTESLGNLKQKNKKKIVVIFELLPIDKE